MLKKSILRFAACLAFAAASFMVSAPALAQAEPTINQIYETAQSGKLDQAQTMVQQVLVMHPNSAKAHFVQAELFSRQGLPAKAREALSTADKLAPGLPFAKPEAVQALRTQLTSKPGPVAASGKQGFGMETPATATSSVPPGLLLLLGVGVVGLVVWLIRRKPATATTYGAPAGSPMAMNAGMGIGSGLNGPQTFGTGTGTNTGPAYGQPGYAQPGQAGFGQAPAAAGMGGRVMGGLAAGLAVGAGVMAAQAIGKNLMGHDANNADTNAGHLNDNAGNRFDPLPGNADLGGQNFGMNDSASWDDAGSGDIGGGDWDS